MQLTWLTGAPSRPVLVHNRAFGQRGLGSSATQLMRAAIDPGELTRQAAVNVAPVIPRVYDATGAMQSAVVQSSEVELPAVVTPAAAQAQVETPTAVVIGLGLLAAAGLIGAWALTHRPATRRHGPRHV